MTQYFGIPLFLGYSFLGPKAIATPFMQRDRKPISFVSVLGRKLDSRTTKFCNLPPGPL